MTHRTALIALALATMPAAAQSTRPADGEADLPVKAVTLFSSGVGFFEHAGTVDGDAATQLRFKADQIDDLLKSLVLQDLDGGTVNAVTYPSVEPLDRQLGSFQIDLGNDASLVGILRQLKGATVTLRTADVQPVSGTVVSVDERTVVEGETTVTKPFITLFTGAGLTSVAVSDVTDFEIEDERLRQELSRALEALARARDKDKKAVGFDFSGDGERRVRMGYVVETPVWKTSYRLILPATDDGEVTLQGWAIVENQTDNDWQDVQLSLVSGRPISFEMDLSRPLFVDRPIVEIPRYASLTPRTYEGGTAGEADDLRQAEAMSRRGLTGGGGGGFGGGGGGGGGREFDGLAAPALEPMDMAGSVASVASASELGEYFEYTVGNVSVPRQSSAMLPIIAEGVGAEKVSLYDPTQLEKHPLNAAILTNSTGKPMLAGPVTVFEAGGYAGDSQVGDVPAGSDRLLTFGVDLKIEARVEPGRSRSELVTGSISRGVLTLTRRVRNSFTYVFDNTTDAERTLVLQHPYDRAGTLVDTPEPYETTDDARRFKLALDPGPSRFAVTTETTTDERRQLLAGDFDADALLALSRGEALPQDVRDALEKAAELRRAVATAQEQLDRVEAEVASIAQEQERIRKNMEAVDAGSAYYKRLLTKLDEQETRIETLSEREADLREALEQARVAYQDYLADLSV